MSKFDASIDASKEGVGIGIKTFIEGNRCSWQKVAEFNRDRDLYEGASPEELVNVITNLRNKRIETTKNIYKLNELCYHCVVRRPGKMRIYEVGMDLIQLDGLKEVSLDRNTIRFLDGLSEYSFNISKSTLYKRFETPKKLMEIDVQILRSPFDVLEHLLEGDSQFKELVFEPIQKEVEHIFLPLYSAHTNKVEEKSALNQWNAKGRVRHYDEIYVPIPSLIYKKYPNFFPKGGQPFELELPDGEVMSVKVCQEGGKALMSNPNKALGKWLLRDVLNLKPKELLTLGKLREVKGCIRL